MQASNIPAKIPIPFGTDAAGGTIRVIPATPSGGPTDASFQTGYPTGCFNSPGAPDGRDVQYLGLITTSWERWFQAGAPVAWDSTFSGQIGGYPKGACVQSATQLGVYWYSTADNNTTNPDSSGVGWVGFSPLPNYGVDAGSANAIVITVPTQYTNLAAMAGKTFLFKKIASPNTSSMTMSVNGFSGALVLATGAAMASGNLPASVTGLVFCDGTKFLLLTAPAIATTPSTSLCWAICTVSGGVCTTVANYPSGSAVTVARTGSGTYQISTNFAIAIGCPCPMPNNTNSLAGWGQYTGGGAGTNFQFGFENRGGGGTQDPTSFYVEINGSLT